MGSTQDNAPDSDQDDIRALLQQSSSDKLGAYDPDQSLRRVLSHARQQTATRDIVSFFMSWIWMLFAGFGASMYQAGQRRHPTLKRPRRPRQAPLAANKSKPEQPGEPLKKSPD